MDLKKEVRIQMKKTILDLINKKVNEEITEFEEVSIYSMGEDEEVIKGKKEKGERLKFIAVTKDKRIFQAEIHINENVIETEKDIEQLIEIIISQINNLSKEKIDKLIKVTNFKDLQEMVKDSLDKSDKSYILVAVIWEKKNKKEVQELIFAEIDNADKTTIRDKLNELTKKV